MAKAPAARKGALVDPIVYFQNLNLEIRKKALGTGRDPIADSKFIAKYISDNKLKSAGVLYMGDDLPDLPAMQIVGLPCCPADAVMEVKEVVQYISPLNGGFACVRDVIEKVLRLNDQWTYQPDIASR